MFRVYILLIEINYCRNCHLLHVADILHVDQSCKNWHNILVNFGCSCLLLHGGYFKETTAPIHQYFFTPIVSIYVVELFHMVDSVALCGRK